MSHRKAASTNCSVHLYMLALVCVPACDFGPSAEQKSEAARVSRAVDALRSAPNESKAPLLATLRTLSVAQADVQQLKESCVAAYELHVRAIERTRKARAGLGASALVASEALRDLELAKTELSQAEQKALTCSEQQVRVRRHYKL